MNYIKIRVSNLLQPPICNATAERLNQPRYTSP